MNHTTPVDLLTLGLLTVVLLGLTLSSGVESHPLQVALGVVVTFFAPGYALVAVLVPYSDHVIEVHDTTRVSLTLGERCLIAVGLSLVLVPLVGLVLSYSPWGLDQTPFVVSIGLLTLLFILIGTVRRLQLPPARRFQVPFWTVPERIWNGVGGAETRWEIGVNILLILGVLAVTVGIGAAVVVSGDGETYTEFSVQPDATSGDGSLSNVSLTDDSGVEVAITNQEHETEQYSVIVELHRVDGQGPNATVVEREEVQRFTQTVDHGESWDQEIAVESGMTDERLRLTFLLYIEAVPETPSTENAYRSVYIWVDAPDG